ncbi:MAG TPA: antibiotic biosynthesis monooxygenase [Herpetosiphon sp.]|uniref:Antibiotic biosynthesis monooxygenase n=1 Tax=Herpetosiphon aurantiacus (strain ATCC 23779 / DSM 785 / 114-95) TaxID=316274 RepID=A9B2U8_HERA2|nr:putative quinol monooxygenase [Herpetosiphon sp.]ABX06011.1 Antibiotic biosynthesis monooxygenase [Herpetosiphon aurantiacus DSM 785]MCA0351926.1 antibiotic biosynthesis monooxygenase [Chloroflexota bacterium]HBW49483.1 antibiotic biosynthesis monooxygenase [Herpetosiphon sp.]
MVVRLVRLKFAPEHVAEFLAFYAECEPTIRHQEGCLALSLLRETGDPTAFATWSTWESGRDLQRYRRSEFFRGFWPRVKSLLREPADAVSYDALTGDAIPDFHPQPTHGAQLTPLEVE